MSKNEFPSDPAALVDALLAWAVREGATDLHFSPFSEGFLVRGRIDGVLRDVHALDGASFPKVVSRLKVMAEMDIAEKRRPQDGRISLVVEDRPVDFRASSIPGLLGESIALRVQDRSAGLRALDQLGLPAREVRVFRSFLSHANGMMIVSGPTGAGKTTTLYAALKEVASPDRNVLTIEDPIEYELHRVLQTAVHARLGVTFAGLLRSILRHDPDVIMVGEIRDGETAKVAVRAALTGHLVLTSLHTGKASHGVSALLNFGVKPYALAPALRGVMAQALLRTICPGCKTRYEYGEQILGDPDFEGILKEGEQPSFSMGMGCDACFQSGYRGRTGIFEVLEVDEEVRKAILRSAGAGEIERTAVEAGMVTLRKNGFRAVLAGVTTIEEVVGSVHIEERP